MENGNLQIWNCRLKKKYWRKHRTKNYYKRSKPQEKLATIENVYNSYFRVKFEEANRVGSYNYTDLFTRSVEVSMYNGETYEPLVQPQLEVKKPKAQEATLIENS